MSASFFWKSRETKINFLLFRKMSKEDLEWKVDPFLSGIDVTNFYYVEVGKCTKVRYFLSGQICENYNLVRFCTLVQIFRWEEF